MQEALTALSAANSARTAVLPARLTQNPMRTLALEWLRRRNAVLDTVFYDVGVITPPEAEALAPWLAHQGAIVVTPPSGGPSLSVHQDLEAFLAAPAFADVRTVAVAGVGSSALGAAALARNIADARGETVAAIVSGYGFADVATEALGGWFCFGALNSLRHAFAPLDRVSHLFQLDEAADESLLGVSLARLSPDTSTLARLLAHPAFRPELMVGHSKGNLIISEALYWLREQDEARAVAVGASCAIATFCAKVDMPPECRRVIDVTGEYDGFGALNSRPDILSDYVVPHAWHSTNPEFPLRLGLDVKAAMQAIEPLLATPPPNQTADDRPIPSGAAQLAVAHLRV